MSMRTTLGATAFAVAAKALERFLATSGDWVRGVTEVPGAGSCATAAAGRGSPALAVELRPFCSHDSSKPAMPMSAMMACPRSLMVVLFRCGRVITASSVDKVDARGDPRLF
jgi:hypothetical protein